MSKHIFKIFLVAVAFSYSASATLIQFGGNMNGNGTGAYKATGVDFGVALNGVVYGSDGVTNGLSISGGDLHWDGSGTVADPATMTFMGLTMTGLVTTNGVESTIDANNVRYGVVGGASGAVDEGEQIVLSFNQDVRLHYLDFQAFTGADGISAVAPENGASEKIFMLMGLSLV